MTSHLVCPYIYLMRSTRFFSTPIERRHFHRASLKSQDSIECLFKVPMDGDMSLFGLLQHLPDNENSISGSSGAPESTLLFRCCSIVSWILLSTILQKTLAGTDSSVMAGSSLSPFLYTGKIRPLLHSNGVLPCKKLQC